MFFGFQDIVNYNAMRQANCRAWNSFFNRDVMPGKYMITLGTTMIAGEDRPDYLCRLAADSAAGDGSLRSNRQNL